MSHPLDNAVIFGSPGMGEVIHITPLIAALRSPTLVVKEWHVPIFDRLGWDVRTLSPGNYRPGRTIELTRADADALGLDHRPCIAPLVRGGVFIDGEPAPTLVPGVMGRCPRHLSLTEKMLTEYGIEGPTDMHVSRIARPDHCPTLTIASSGEALRTVPPHVILGLLRRISGWRVNIISAVNPSEIEAANGGRNEVKACYPASLTPSEFEATLATVQRSHVVVAADCGWAWVSLASGIKTLIIESRDLLETLVPKNYWSPHGLAVILPSPKKLSCDRQCSAQRLLAAMPPGVARPYEEFEDYRHMTPEWKDRHYISGYPRTLACWGTINPPCMDYDEATLDRLAAQVLDALQP